MWNEMKHVTDRSLEFTADQFKNEGFNLSDEVCLFPENAVVLISGSGVVGKLEGGLKIIRDDIKTVSVDPTLDFDSTRTDMIDLANGETLSYVPKNNDEHKYGLLPAERAKKLHALRIKNHNSDCPMVADAEFLPFGKNSFDVVLDVLGPIHYFSINRQVSSVRKYVEDLFGNVKKGGLIYFFNVDSSILELVESVGSFEIVTPRRILDEREYFTLKLRVR